MEPSVGFRFLPTDEELVNYFLRHKRLGNDSKVRAIAEVDVYEWEPYELPMLSAVKSDDREWFFFCPREIKYTSSCRAKRATKSGFWKATGKDRKIKAKRTNEMIGTKKTLVFHKGRGHDGVRTNWVMHEYHSASNLPQQKDFVLCRIKSKTDAKIDVSTCDEGEAGSYTASDFEIQAPYDSIPEREADLELFFQPTFQSQDFDFASSLQLPVSITQGSPFINPVFSNSHSNELNWMSFLSDRDEQEDDTTEFLNSLIVDQDENSYEQTMHFNDVRAPQSVEKVLYLGDSGPSSDSDTEIVGLQARTLGMETSRGLFNVHFSPQKVLKMPTKELQSATGSSSSPNRGQYRRGGNISHHDDFFDTIHPSINCISRVRTISPPKVRASTPQHQRRFQVARRKVLLPGNNSHRIASHDKAKNDLRDSITASLPQKETSIMDSDKEQKMVQCTNTKKSFKSTTLDSSGSDRKGYFIFVESSQESHISSPPLIYLAKLLFGLFLFLVFIREAVLYEM